MRVALISYLAAALAYGLLAAALIARRESVRQGQRVLVAVAGTGAWGAAVAALVWLSGGARLDLTLVPDAMRTQLWIFCLLTALPGPTLRRSVKGAMALGAVALGGASMLAALAGAGGLAALTMLALSLLGCLTLEQILRNSTEQQKGVIQPFLLGMTAILAYDLFVYSDAVLFGAIDARLWAARGIVAAVAVPFFLLAAKRHPDWQETLFISREIVFYSATLTAVGLYLIAMAVGAFIIRERGGEWGPTVQVGYLVAALAMLASALSSARLKGNLRVFISKHFYRNRYDYRDEWLRLIRTLSDNDQSLPVEQRGIKALCAIASSDGGQLWLDRDGRSIFEPFAAWQAPFPAIEYSALSPLVQFLHTHKWVIDTREYERNPDRYDNAFRDGPDRLPRESLIVPLFHQNEMLGFVRMNRGVRAGELNYEDHDLLKTAGTQVAAFLAHDLARERLMEAQQFEAYSKLSAFVMHDLKNVLAQQALLLANAKKFGQRPEFLEDVMRTVDSGVQRMRRLLRQLQQGATVAQLERVELNKLLLRVVSDCSHDGKVPCSFRAGDALWVKASAEQLGSVLAHVVRNAQDATAAGGAVNVSLTRCPDDRAVVEIRDSGAGMTEEFIRRKLFKPFESTKGALGMGIGAHQAREVVRGLGGDIVAESEPARGTAVRIYLPLEAATGSPQPAVTVGT